MGGPALALFAVAFLAVLAAGCSYTVVVTKPGPSFDPNATDRPIGATPWPNGTTGANGLRIDPSLSGHLPSYVGGNPLVEDAGSELIDVANNSYAQGFDSMYVAQVGDITSLNWVQATLASVKGGVIDPGFYTSWRDHWFKIACSQAGGVSATATAAIQDWDTDTATCSGGVRAYTVNLGDGLLLSIIDLGPRNLGRELIQALP